MTEKRRIRLILKCLSSWVQESLPSFDRYSNGSAAPDDRLHSMQVGTRLCVVMCLASGTLHAQCAACHPQIAASFAKTGMGRSFFKPTSIEPLTFYHEPSHTFYAVTERNGS